MNIIESGQISWMRGKTLVVKTYGDIMSAETSYKGMIGKHCATGFVVKPGTPVPKAPRVEATPKVAEPEPEKKDESDRDNRRSRQKAEAASETKDSTVKTENADE